MLRLNNRDFSLSILLICDDYPRHPLWLGNLDLPNHVLCQEFGLQGLHQCLFLTFNTFSIESLSWGSFPCNCCCKHTSLTQRQYHFCYQQYWCFLSPHCFSHVGHSYRSTEPIFDQVHKEQKLFLDHSYWHNW